MHALLKLVVRMGTHTAEARPSRAMHKTHVGEDSRVTRWAGWLFQGRQRRERVVMHGAEVG